MQGPAPERAQEDRGDQVNRFPSAAVLAVLLAVPLHAADDNGRTAALILTRTQSALPAALGGAFAGADGRLEGSFTNPASTARMPATRALTTYQRGLVDDALGTVELGIPVGFGAINAGVGYYDAGRFDVNLSNGVSESRRLQRDAVGWLGVSAGRRGPLAVGAAVKAFQLEVAEEAEADGVAFDVGALLRTPLEGLTFGVSSANLGSDVEFESEADPLPATSRAGVAYVLDFSRFEGFGANPWLVGLFADAVSERRSGTSGRAGLELARRMVTMERTGSVALRGGYQSEPRSYTAGLGFELGSFGLDYAIAIVDDVDNAHRVSLSWRFVPPEEPPEIRRRPAL